MESELPAEAHDLVLGLTNSVDAAPRVRSGRGIVHDRAVVNKHVGLGVKTVGRICSPTPRRASLCFSPSQAESWSMAIWAYSLRHLTCCHLRGNGSRPRSRYVSR